ncbi:Chalcone synthase [Microcystis aeruginosa NIES-2549]|uniref:Chalcone synthase n=1 Tax=Microcystis aeruginosa NIES-2549 TaxID=1641812 RepID=A0A0F6U6Z5_MICAE|nr:naringenin-chalcone synthase [Microcystis aeruginosa]AKE66339.1 Chalcone synthase [Microcystis aeruginosa NIES-2549]AOC54747.1 Chalcone synthase [Microcystis aeruginosa NIES-2481]
MQSSQFLPVIESLATGTPGNLVQQTDAAKFLANLKGLEKNQHRIEKIYEHTRIDTRHLAINLLTEETVNFSREEGTIEQRMQMYEKYGLPLAEDVARRVILAASEQQKKHNPLSTEKIEDSIGLIVFVTSTGFVAPGIDAQLIKSLGLRRNIARVPVNFMGCAAAMNGLRVACDHVRANPEHKALVICLELSSINAVFQDDLNDIIIHSIFGDGCAAVVIGAYEPEQIQGRGKFIIRDNFSYLAENTEDGITLGIRDNGITCLLSRQLPDYIESGVGRIITNFLNSHEITKEDIDLWMVHPGGTKIIEKVQLSLDLNDEQVADSWGVLRQYGNLLSCAILFVMERMILRLEQGCETQALKQNNSGVTRQNAASLTGLAFSFAPGVGIEGILLEKI